jgi:hypothetical protein
MIMEVKTMWLPFRRRGERDARAESRRSRRLERALHEDASRELLESENARADLDNASVRLSALSRSGPTGAFGANFRRRSTRPTLRDEGYDGD